MIIQNKERAHIEPAVHSVRSRPILKALFQTTPALGFFLASAVIALPARAGSVPPCMDRDQRAPLQVMNEKVLDWKKTTRNQFQDRALVEGRVVRLIQMRPSHTHFEVYIGNGRGDRAKDTIEVIYNREFGELPTIREGMDVEVCGDYITARARSGGYPPSPAGAILHWVHTNPGDRDGGIHEDGFVMIDGVLYGDDAPAPTSSHR